MLLPYRFYEKAEESQLPDILRDCMALFRSEAMFLLLSNFTGLKLHFLAPSEDEPEDKKEQDGASAAENTEEGTSHSSSEPENSRGATSDSSLQSDGPTDPEEDEAKKGELLLCSILILPLGIHNSVVYSFNRYFLSTYYVLGPASGLGRSRQTRSQLSLSPYILVGERPEIT